MKTKSFKKAGLSLLIFFAFMVTFAIGSISEEPAKPKIEIKNVDAQNALVIKADIPTSEIGNKMGELYQQLFSYMGSAQIQPAGPPFAVYYSYEPEGNTVFETGIPVQGKSEGKGEIIYKEYPGMKVVSTLFIGAYEDMGHIYQALENYLKENKLESTGSSWEVYLTDPGEVESPDENKTLIYFPIK